MTCPSSSPLLWPPLYRVPRARATNPPSRVPHHENYRDPGDTLTPELQPVWHSPDSLRLTQDRQWSLLAGTTARSDRESLLQGYLPQDFLRYPTKIPPLAIDFNGFCRAIPYTKKPETLHLAVISGFPWTNVDYREVAQGVIKRLSSLGDSPAHVDTTPRKRKHGR